MMGSRYTTWRALRSWRTMKPGTMGASARSPMRAMPAFVLAGGPKNSTHTPRPRVGFWSKGRTSNCFSRSARSTSVAAWCLRTRRVPARARNAVSQRSMERVPDRTVHHGERMAAPAVGIDKQLPVAEVAAKEQDTRRPLPADRLAPPGLVLEADHVTQLLVAQVRQVGELRRHAAEVQHRRAQDALALGEWPFREGDGEVREAHAPERNGEPVDQQHHRLRHAEREAEREGGEEAHDASEREVLDTVAQGRGSAAAPWPAGDVPGDL